MAEFILAELSDRLGRLIAIKERKLLLSGPLIESAEEQAKSYADLGLKKLEVQFEMRKVLLTEILKRS